ncbi:hypothetical protein KEM54_005804, partial [Ascosphaera aggregata]
MDGLSREDRRLMRQRGAGNRAGKAVDFGFSFGSPPPEPPAQRVNPKASITSNAQPALTEENDLETRQQSPSVPRSSPGKSVRRRSQTPGRLTPVRKTPTPTKLRTRTLSSAGESSPYDIPRDEDTDQDARRDDEQERSAKRRRLLQNGPQGVARTSLNRVSEDIEDSTTSEYHGRTETGQNDDTGLSTLSSMINVTIQSSPLNGLTLEDNRSKKSQQETYNAAAETETLRTVQQRSPQLAQHPAPESSGNYDDPSHPQSPIINNEISERVQQQQYNETESTPTGGDHVHEPISDSPTDQVEIGNGQVRHSKSIDDSPVMTAQNEVSIDRDGSNEVREAAIDGTADNTDQAEERPVVIIPPADTAKRARPGLRERVKSTVHNSVSRVVDKFRKRKRDGDPSKSKEPEERRSKDTTPPEESENEPSTIQERNRESQNRKEKLRNGVQDAGSDERNSVPDSAETSAQPSRFKKNRRKPMHGDRDGSIPRRQPAVPVTVHRLSKLTALDPQHDETEDSDEENSPEGKRGSISRHIRRSGVNSVDILNQVCRETFDDVLSALQDDFASEGDKKRRADIVQRIRAVQAFSAELEHRLFDIREILDTNY